MAEAGFVSEYELKESEYRQLRDIVYDHAGIHLGDNKKELVHARLTKILRKRGIPDFRQYIQILDADSSDDELIMLLDAISTNVTHFFREQEHFNFLAEILPDLQKNKPIRVWSAGCSSGEEPYSLAITLKEYHEKTGGPEPAIIATDLSTKVLKKAVGAVYPMKAVDRLDQSLLRKYFLKGKGSAENFVKVKKDVTRLVTFERMNLMEPVRFSQEFDIIFCRNVMIYFDGITRTNVVRKYHEALNTGGYLFIGHSESLNGIEHDFSYVRPTIYRKTR